MEMTKMKVNWKAGGGIAAGAIVGLGIAYVLREKAAPRPNWRVLVSEGDLQIRAYPAIRVLETIVPGPRKEALNNGYRLLAAFALGQNLPITVPFLQDAGNPMASDPPLFDDAMEGGWRVRFILPDDAGELGPRPREWRSSRFRPGDWARRPSTAPRMTSGCKRPRTDCAAGLRATASSASRPNPNMASSTRR
jgi:hypothetical protein